MKNVFRFLFFVLTFYCPIFLGAICNADEQLELPELDPNRPIYQAIIPGVFGFGGLYRKVRERDAQTLEEAKLRAEIERINRKLKQEANDRAHGVKWMRIGVALFVVGGIGFVMLKNYGFEMFGVAAALFGVGSVCYGAIVIKVAENSTAIAASGIAAVGIGFAAWFCHGKGFSIRETISRIKKKT